MNKLKVYKFIVIKKKKKTPGAGLGASQFSGIRAQMGASQVISNSAPRIRFGSVNRVGSEMQRHS